MERDRPSHAAEAAAAKRVLRTAMLARRAALSPQRLREVGAAIVEHVLADAAFGHARTVAVYAATGGEPDVREVFERGRALGKRMLLPRCAEERRLQFHVVERWSELVPGRYALLEPPPASTSVQTHAIELALVPCVAVDGSGVRLGRGGGWYDRAFLARASTGGPQLVAVVHAFQRVEHVPREATDRVVDGVVCEDGLTWIGGAAGRRGPSVGASEGRT